MFTEDELESARILTTPVVARSERPFELDRCLDVYESGLPRAETRTTQAWRTERWIEDWGCDSRGRRFEGLLSRDEAQFWWLAWTLTGRLGDSSERAESVDILRTVWANESREEPDADWCWNRLKEFHRRASSYYDVWALTSMAPSASILRELVGRSVALGIVLEIVPPVHLASWIEWIGPPELSELDRYCANANRWAARWSPDEPSMPAWCTLAKHARTQEVIAPAKAFALEHKDLRGSDAWLLDLARADARPGSFSRWVSKGRAVPEPLIAQEMVARDGDRGVEALAEILTRVAARGTTSRVPNLAELVGALVELPRSEFVEPMLDLLERPDAGNQARLWLRSAGVTLIADLAAIALGRTKRAGAAINALRELQQLEPGAFDATLATQDEDERDRLSELISSNRRPTPVTDPIPDWAETYLLQDDWSVAIPDEERTLLPPLLVGGARLPEDVVDGILSALGDVRLELDTRAGTPRDSVPPAIEALRTNLDEDSADRFARALFDVWLRSEDHHATRWCMRSVAFLGGEGALDHVVGALIDYRKWLSAEDALSALDAIRRHGSPYAMSLLAWISEFHRAPRIRAHARIELEAVANTRGVSPDSLLDCATPAPSTPSRRELIRELHAVRWERAMVGYRTFDHDEWRQNVLEHPVLGPLARTVLWMVTTEDAGFLSAFRVSDDLELAGPGEAPLTLQPWERVGVAHPAELPPPELERWNQLFADYELVQPFEQLHREVFRASEPLQFEPLETQILRARTAKHWSAMRGKNQMIVGFRRSFPEVGITAHIHLAEGFEIRPIAAGGLVPVDAEIDRIEFHTEFGQVPAESVPPGIYSEVVATLG